MIRQPTCEWVCPESPITPFPAPGRAGRSRILNLDTTNGELECQLKRQSGSLNCENLVAKVFPITISSAAMVKEKGRLIGMWEGSFDSRVTQSNTSVHSVGLVSEKRTLKGALAVLLW